ncbi:MAG TPA: GlsB/YeaQ/YmgE family stress response membrane protein [Mycobacteriales bacterium]|nr:GlsB/YeaQ/YmgE family stress response membrane protein [Mycobacteriales bacterium]
MEEPVLWFIISLIIIGAIAGFIARALVPGKDPMGIGATILLGVVGSFIGGFLGWALFGKDMSEGALQPAGIIGSIIGAIIALLIYRAATRRGVGGRTRTRL